MKRAKDIEKHIKDIYANKLQVTTSADLDKKILTNSMNTLEELKNKKSAKSVPNIWRIIMTSRITKFAASVVIIIAVILALNIIGGPNIASVAYGIVDLPAIMEQAQTIQITGWRYLDDSAIVADNKSERVASDCYIDNRYERLRWSQYGFDTTIDGQIMTKINHHDNTVRFYKLSDFQRKVWLRMMHDWNFDRAFMSKEELSEFVKTGHETIEETEFNIWERVTNYWYPSDREIKSRVWMSPITGEVRRIGEWQRGEFTKGRWCITSDNTIKINRGFETGIFEPVVPDGYRLKNTKENAPEYQSLIMAFYADGKRSEVRYVFTMENGTVIIAWSTGILLSDENSVALYKALKSGQSMPTKPVEIMYGLTPKGKPRYDSSDYDVTFDDTSVTYNGRFLDWTVKDGQLYEWAIYVPNKKVDLREVLHRGEIVIGMDPENPTWKGVERSSLYSNTMVIYDDEFNIFVLGAMAELSDDEVIPEHMTYNNILNQVNEIRTNMKE